MWPQVGWRSHAAAGGAAVAAAAVAAAAAPAAVAVAAGERVAHIGHPACPMPACLPGSKQPGKLGEAGRAAAAWPGARSGQQATVVVPCTAD